MSFSIVPTTRFRRQARALRKKHPKEFSDLFDLARDILAIDPLNKNRRHNILKLTDTPTGQGQYRLRLRRFRFRYDVEGKTVYLLYCGLRREDTYK